MAHPVPKSKWRRLKLPEVLPVFKRYHDMPANEAWGSLHIVLDDGNVRRHHIEWAIIWARERQDEIGEELGRILLVLSFSQRRRLSGLV